MKLRLPNVISRLQSRSQVVDNALARLGEDLVQSPIGTRALALELCREFEDKFLQYIHSGEAGGWKVVACFEGNFPNRIKQLPLDRHFDLHNVKKIVLEADGYQPYLISPEKGLRSLIKGVLELAKDPARLSVDEVHRVLTEIVSTAANATPGLARYPPFKKEIVAIASAALEEFKAEARKMVVALVDMERAFIPPQHFVRLIQRRLERQRREDELKNRASKKGHETEQSLLNRATSPQPGSQPAGGNLKSLKDKGNPSDKDNKEGSVTIAGPNGELTAGFLLKKSAKKGGWSRRWFVLNEKTGKLGYTNNKEEKHFRGVITLEECVIEEIPEEESSGKKDSKKSNGPDKSSVALVFKISSKVPYKTVVKAHGTVILKAETPSDKAEWMSKLSNYMQVSKTSSSKGQVSASTDTPVSLRASNSDGALDTMPRRFVDPEEELKMISQEVRGYVEAVLNSLAANVPKAIVLFQVQKAEDDMLTQLYSSISSQSSARMEELLQEDQSSKREREKYQKQASLLAKLTRQLSIHDVGGSTNESWSANEGSGSTSPLSGGNEDWRVAFEAAANGPSDYGSLMRDSSRSNSSKMNGYSGSGRYSENGDSNASRRTPNRMPPPPPRY